jgi:hypothetical protein
VRESYAAFTAAGTRVIAVGTAAPFQARRLMEQGIPFPCLLDPDRQLYRALGLGRVGWSTVFRRDTYLNYWRAWRRGARQGAVTGDTRQLPGVAVFDAEGRLRWLHRGATVGDYPPVAAVLAAVRNVGA